jgi:hypothetical protein
MCRCRKTQDFAAVVFENEHPYSANLHKVLDAVSGQPV